MLAPSFRISTCAATMPASSTPSSGIHARPRTTRSSHAMVGQRHDECAERGAEPVAGFALFAGAAGAGRGRILGAGAR